MKTLYFECKMGAAGDMLQSALFELLEPAQKEEFLSAMNQIFGETIQIAPTSASTCGISGTRMQVLVLGQEEGAAHMHEHEHCHEHELEHEHEHEHDHEHEHFHEHVLEHEHCHEHEHEHVHGHHHTHAHYSYSGVCEQIRNLPVTEEVKAHAKAVYLMIGQAEAKVHNSDLENIHFHEVGSLDALADVTGVSLLISLLAPEQILVSPIHVGSGMIRCAHGILPVPAPATAEILKGVPYYSGNIQTELCTPTGAALLKHFADSFCQMPLMTVEKIGIGIGTRETGAANMVRVFLGEAESAKKADGDIILDLSCNVDDMTGEELGFLMDQLFDEGALDVFYESIHMKKNRPGTLIHCLCQTEEKDHFTMQLLKYTTTRGIRYQAYQRAKMNYRIEEVQTSFGPVRKKINEGYGLLKSKYEYEDLKRIAKEQNLSISELIKLLPIC